MSTSSVENTSARSVSSSAPSCVVSTVWCGPPAVSQPSVAVGKSGRGCQTARATGRFGNGSSGSTTSISLATQRNRSPRSDQPMTTPSAGAAVKTRRSRVPATADPQRVHLEPRLLAGDRRADLEHVRPEDLLAARLQVVGVVLHERRPAGEARAGDLEHPQQCGGLPVALTAEAVAVGHPPPDGE